MTLPDHPFAAPGGGGAQLYLGQFYEGFVSSVAS